MLSSNITIYIVAIVIVYTISCSDNNDEISDLAELDGLRNEVNSLIGDVICNDIDDCGFMGLGTKPCGGPWEYVIFSVLNTDTAELGAKVLEYNNFNRILNERYEYSSDCSIVETPRLVCISGKCADRNKLAEEEP